MRAKALCRVGVPPVGVGRAVLVGVGVRVNVAVCACAVAATSSAIKGTMTRIATTGECLSAAECGSGSRSGSRCAWGSWQSTVPSMRRA